ncbi:SCO2524 family protein [Dactylosporangium sp. NBC_01737]|uniref:SCO2524 family protein n=1 Tax=Dactylosporangium sp. NBC_01737 TaxID=2975959 RepID=UPI002E140C75|nr:SCO2524 family protein [Dactylosporangium sp. NBC_01737]
MRIQPRQQLLDIWRHTVKASYREQRWHPAGGSSVSDAEQLLCLMSPATKLAPFQLGMPDKVAPDVEEALRSLGSPLEVPRRLLDILAAHIARYTAQDGTPRFPGGTSFRSRDPAAAVRPEQQDRDVVDSFAVSVTLMLAIIGFTQDFRRVATRPELLERINDLEHRASLRLTAAMVGLLRSFAVHVFSMDGETGRHLMRTVNQGHRAPDQVAERLHEALKQVIAGLRDDRTISTGNKSEHLENPYWLFECGWSWGVVSGAEQVETRAHIGAQRDGVAENAPYLYFTTVAMDAAEALASERTRLPGWLDAEQLRLAQQLQVRSELVRAYWTTVATFDSGGRWPIEDLPWRTTDGRETDYYSLLVAGLVRPPPGDGGPGGDGTDLGRIGAVLERLAERSRITARVTGRNADGIEMHHPGVGFPLVGSAATTGPELEWTFSDMAPILLKRTLELIGAMPDGDQRRTAVDLAERVWEHLDRRRIPAGTGERLWDRPAGVFTETDLPEGSLSWYYTKRIVDCLVTAARMIGAPPKPAEWLLQFATGLLDEAGHLHDRELFNCSAKAGTKRREELDRMGVELRLARDVLATQPGVAVSIAQAVLRELGVLAAAQRAGT